MSTWHPISTAPKDRLIDLWSEKHGHFINCRYFELSAVWSSCGLGHVTDATHWREPDKGPGMEEGEVRWMMERNGALMDLAHHSEDDANLLCALVTRQKPADNSDVYRVVRVRIVREGNERGSNSTATRRLS